MGRRVLPKDEDKPLALELLQFDTSGQATLEVYGSSIPDDYWKVDAYDAAQLKDAQHPLGRFFIANVHGDNMPPLVDTWVCLAAVRHRLPAMNFMRRLASAGLRHFPSQFAC